MTTTSSYKHVMRQLYESHYVNHSGYSPVTSSHWQEIGDHKASLIDESFELKGAGFGHRLKRDWLRQCYSIPEKIMMRWMLSQYPDLKWIYSLAKEVAVKQGTVFGYDCLRQALSLAIIVRNMSNDVGVLKSKGGRVCIIGDGYGYLACLFRKVFSTVQIIEVNLGRTLLFDAEYIQKVYPNEEVAILQSQSDCNGINETDAAFVFLEAEKYELIEYLPVDLFVNVASMQEMNISVVQNYLQYMRNSQSDKKFFYCCNRLEKLLPDGEVIRFSEYGWRDEDMVMLDELCPWYQKFPVPYPPFWKSFDGPIQHRFLRMK